MGNSALFSQARSVLCRCSSLSASRGAAVPRRQSVRESVAAPIMTLPECWSGAWCASQMEAASMAIKRDIVFSASLYVARA